MPCTWRKEPRRPAEASLGRDGGGKWLIQATPGVEGALHPMLGGCFDEKAKVSNRERLGRGVMREGEFDVGYTIHTPLTTIDLALKPCTVRVALFADGALRAAWSRRPRLPNCGASREARGNFSRRGSMGVRRSSHEFRYGFRRFRRESN